MPVFTKSGLAAVMCFFVISGFSIHHSLRQRPSGYFRRRFWRIFPTNAASVAIGFVAYYVFDIKTGYLAPQKTLAVFNFIGCLLLVESVLPVMISFLYPSWSLSIEVLYYIFAPTIENFSSSRFIKLAIILSVFLFIFWPFFSDKYIAWKDPYLSATIGLFWAWMTGWIAYSRPKNIFLAVSFFLCGMMSFYFSAKYFDIHNWTSALGTYLSWGVVIFICFFQTGSSNNRTINSVMRYLGELSFPLYILHYPVFYIISNSIFSTHPNLNHGIVLVFIAITVSIFVYHFLDKPLRSFGRSPRTKFRVKSS